MMDAHSAKYFSFDILNEVIVPVQENTGRKSHVSVLYRLEKNTRGGNTVWKKKGGRWIFCVSEC